MLWSQEIETTQPTTQEALQHRESQRNPVWLPSKTPAMTLRSRCYDSTHWMPSGSGGQHLIVLSVAMAQLWLSPAAMAL